MDKKTLRYILTAAAVSLLGILVMYATGSAVYKAYKIHMGNPDAIVTDITAEQNNPYAEQDRAAEDRAAYIASVKERLAAERAGNTAEATETDTNN